MRIPRSIQLHPVEGSVHQYWRCHNKEYYLKDPLMKNLYLGCLKEIYVDEKKKDNPLKINAYTCMDNHFHNLINYHDGSTKLSNFLRKSHSLFGSRYNKRHQRSGKVAEGRPKTSLIENTEHLMRVHFYIEANPLRAGKCNLRQLKGYKHSSYRFYAYGIMDEFTEMLTVPDWYLELGNKPHKRQARYRALFLEYLKKSFDRTEFFSPYIGSILWQIRSLKTVALLMKLPGEDEFSSA